MRQSRHLVAGVYAVRIRNNPIHQSEQRRLRVSCDKDILKLRPEGASHVSIPSTLNIPLTWLRYDNDGIYSVWMDDGGANKKPYWREIPNNCIEFPECIRSINDIEQLAKANERVRELEKDLAVSNGFIAKKMPIVFAISGNNRGAKLVYEEAVKVLNKFAIEKKIEVLEKVAFETSYDVVSDACNWEIEQLRKEQSHD